jgi:sugar phosphate permease
MLTFSQLDGIQQDLGMSDGQYAAALSLFFVSYAGFEPLTNVLLKRLKPSVFIPAIMVLWGIVMTTMGLVHNGAGLMAARFFLGVAEAGLFPVLVPTKRVRHPSSNLLSQQPP